MCWASSVLFTAIWCAGNSLWELQHVLQVCVLEPLLLAKLMEKAISPGEMSQEKGHWTATNWAGSRLFPVSCKPFGWVTYVAAQQRHRRVGGKRSKKPSTSDHLKNQWGPTVWHYGLIMPFSQLCIHSHCPKGCFCAFPPVTQTILRRELSTGMHSGPIPMSGCDWFFPLHSSHSSFPCLFRLGNRVCLLLLVIAKAGWLISCFSLWEDSSDITHAFKPTGLVPLSSSLYALCSLAALCWCISALDQTFHLQS